MSTVEAAAGVVVDAFVLGAVAAGMAEVIATFGGCESEGLLDAVAFRTYGAAQRLVADVALHYGDYSTGTLAGTRDRIAAVARERLALLIVDAVAHFVAADYEYVH